MKRYYLKNISLDDVKNLARVFSKEKGTAFLFSGKDIDSSGSSYSFIFLFPIESFEISRKDYIEKDPYDLLEEKLALSYEKVDYPSWVGYIGYEFANQFFLDGCNSDLPEIFFQKTAIVLKYNHRQNKLQVFFNKKDVEQVSKDQKKHLNIFENSRVFRNFIKLLSKKELKTFQKPKLKIEKAFENKEQYIAKIKDIQKMIKEGRVYEVNLSHELILRGEVDPFYIFLYLAEKNPAPFSAFMNFPNATIVSSSPERFLLKKNKYLEARPIKGTVERGGDPEEDERNENILKTSEKEKAELRMITDLMRNDLYHISEKGSVEVIKPFHIEKYSNVFQQLSIIKSQSRKGVRFKDIIKNTFPGGSITGCPKLASQEVIFNLERRNRGVYTGSIGYISQSGDFDFNIAIRTLVFQKDNMDANSNYYKNNKISLSVGGAVTFSSDPISEYIETLLKAETMLKALKATIV